MKKRPKILDRILDVLRESNSICVAGHLRPDGDCIGSQIGLGLALRAAGKKVTIWNQDPAPEKLRFLDKQGLLALPVSGHTFDTVITVDCATFERLGTVADHIGKRQHLINIDHHQSNTRYGELNWISAYASSTGELIYKLLRTAKWKITPDIADCLFTAISTDTGSFQYPTTKPSTYTAAGKLVKQGADLATICDEVYQSYTLARVKLLRHVYNSFKLVDDDRVAYFWLKKNDFIRTGAQVTDAEGLIDHLRDIDPVLVACMFEETAPEEVRVSLRSKNPFVNVGKIAELFGGGGHPAAAGARMTGSHLSIQRKVISAVKVAIKELN